LCFQISGLSFAIIHSITIALPAWKRLCRSHTLSERLLPQDVHTRWNSPYHMLQFELKYRKVVDSITAGRALSLRKYELDEVEWKILHDLLTMHKAANLAFSSNSISTIANGIPTMDKIDPLLSLEGEKALHPAVCAATQFAKKSLNKYWFNSDESDV
ncbi:hypothetical protein B0H19DRAFT_947215, partial [Mycena capillaripes]